MFIPWSWAHCSPCNPERTSDKAAWPIRAFCLLLLFGAGPTFAGGTHKPAIDRSQTVGEVIRNGDGTYATYINLTVVNSGNEELVKVQLRDNLAIFGSGSIVRVESLRLLSGNLSLNSNFDGINSRNLLVGTDSLLPGETARLRFKLIFSSGDSAGPFTNVVLAAADGRQSGKLVEDREEGHQIVRSPPRPKVRLAWRNPFTA